nr:response regulator [Herbaspirillum rubrisubalbicans]
MVRELKRGGFEPSWQRVDDEQALLAALHEQRWDIVISDYSMPMFSGVEALKLVKADNDQTPFIIVSGVIGEQTAVEVMKAGAQDYFLSSRWRPAHRTMWPSSSTPPAPPANPRASAIRIAP